MMELAVLGIAVNGPGLPNWPHAKAAFQGKGGDARPTARVTRPARMNTRDRRRASDTVCLAVELGFDAAESARLAPGHLPAVFASCHGEGAATHKLLAALTELNPFISPTLFHNSVHNTPAGYWSIAAGTRAPTTSISAGKFTFAAALMKAAMLVTLDRSPALLVAYDAPFPDPLSRACPFPGPLGVGLVLGPPEASDETLRISLFVEYSSERACSTPKTQGIGQLFEANPIGQCLPLLECIASQADTPIVLRLGEGARIVVEVRTHESRSN